MISFSNATESLGALKAAQDAGKTATLKKCSLQIAEGARQYYGRKGAS
jgi:hypothetical protein